MQYKCTCKHCGNAFMWASQPYSYRLVIGNLILAAACFFVACSPTKFINTFRSAGIACFGSTTYFNLQSAYLLSAVKNVWAECQYSSSTIFSCNRQYRSGALGRLAFYDVAVAGSFMIISLSDTE